jgi:hypothetical protein
MKLHNTVMIAALVLASSALCATAQDTDTRPPRQQGPAAPGGPNGQNRGPGMNRMPPPPVMAALDANHDGVIDATEIANASAALMTLDKNSDGKLTPDELRPPRPEGRRQGGPNGGNGPRGPRGPGGQGEFGGPGGQNPPPNDVNPED